MTKMNKSYFTLMTLCATLYNMIFNAIYLYHAQVINILFCMFNSSLFYFRENKNIIDIHYGTQILPFSS